MKREETLESCGRCDEVIEQVGGGGLCDACLEDEDADESDKPQCKLVGTDGNVFALVGLASKALREAGQREKATELSTRVFGAGSYNEALCIISEYVAIY